MIARAGAAINDETFAAAASDSATRAVDFSATSAAWMIAAIAFKPAEPAAGIVRSNTFGLF